ncbi:OB-fold nucleic acid binding domain-containing protein [Rhodoferax sp.]|uniref:OB-fold nucleic acid binding domain-containing protein n=1 Tax=Rhodoferax sp. TaxID=50421 RepID=UPI0025FCD19D|nr:OB-fold nucleic acid binding domain-containing protein [Rhodoferax sp.]
MKQLFTGSLILSALLTASAWAAGPMSTKPLAKGTVSGEVLEVKDVEIYTYMRLKTKDGETWAAVSTAAVKKGAMVTIENPMVMSDFESKSLKKTFPTIIFGTLAGAGAGQGVAAPKMAMANAADSAAVKVAKASGANAYTVADVVSKATQLKDKPVRVNGQVVKYNASIMGKNWVHLRDGSGTSAKGDNDILVTTAAPAKVGDLVAVSGVVRNDKDFGAGYSYKVLIEDATLTPVKQ